MPVQQGKSALVAKLGTTFITEFEKHKNDETSFGQFGDLPEGIENGVARLVDCKFDVYKEGDNKGQYFFYAAGTVVSPEMVGNVKVLGGRTSIMEALHDTPTRTRKTVGDHLAWILNEMRKLGLDTSKVSHDQLESSAEALKKAQPFFRFRTWKGKKATEGPYAGQEPRVQHTWNGMCEYDETSSNGDGVVDESSAPPPPAPTTKPTAGKPPTKPPVKVAAPAPTPDEIDPPDAGASSEAPDLDALAALADEGDTDAGETLQGLAAAAGADDEAVKNAANWTEVVALIREKEEAPSAEETPAAEEEAWTPKKDEVYYYKPMVTDPKTKKKSKAAKAVECEVTAVDVAKKTVSLKNLNDPKLKYAAAWDELIGDE